MKQIDFFPLFTERIEDLDLRDNPGTLFLARCEANGYGTKKDLHKALMNYQNDIGMCGSNENIDKKVKAIKIELGKKPNHQWSHETQTNHTHPAWRVGGKCGQVSVRQSAGLHHRTDGERTEAGSRGWSTPERIGGR